MNNPIKTTPEELAELIELCGLYLTAGDMTTADDVYTECIKQRAGRDFKWAHYCAVATVFRAGYILGQRHERAKRAARNNAAFEKGIKISAALFESVSEGGDLAKIAAAIKQKRSAETTHTHTHTRRAEIRVLHRLERGAAA